MSRFDNRVVCEGSFGASPFFQALVAWFAFTADRKRKAARFADALRWHQSELLRRGVSTMVAVAGDLAQMRHDLAVKQGAEVRGRQVVTCLRPQP